MNSPTPVVLLHEIAKDYTGLPDPVTVFRNLSLEILPGESLAIVGPSGCGKSTLLNLMGTLDVPTAGRIFFKGQDTAKLASAELAALRNREIGFVFQLHHLLPQCSILENVLVPALLSKKSENPRKRAEMLLERVGLQNRLHHRPGQLSGGERQRAAVARALINRPGILLADEPTGALNQEAAQALTDMLIQLNREERMALVVVTHASAVAQRIGKTLAFQNGVLVSER